MISWIGCFVVAAVFLCLAVNSGLWALVLVVALRFRVGCVADCWFCGFVVVLRLPTLIVLFWSSCLLVVCLAGFWFVLVDCLFCVICVGVVLRWICCGFRVGLTIRGFGLDDCFGWYSVVMISWLTVGLVLGWLVWV